MVVEWMPISLADASTWVSLANGSTALCGSNTSPTHIVLENPQDGSDWDEGAIVGGWLEVSLYSTNGAALTSGRGPVRVHVVGPLPPQVGHSELSFSSMADFKNMEDFFWMWKEVFITEQSSNMTVRFDLTTKRRFKKGAHLVIMGLNATGAAMGTNVTSRVIGELWIHEDTQ